MDYLRRLENIMTRLRSRNGCPWDRRQTHRTLKPYLLEEAHEVLDAIDMDDPKALQEELGDLLLQVVFHAQMAKEKGRFDLQEVAKGIGDKLIRRHPHVFGKSSRRISDINRKWEELKRQEKPERRSALDGLPKSLPSLLRTQRMFEKINKGQKATDKKDLEKQAAKAWQGLQKSLKAGRRGKERAAGEFLLAFTRLAQAEGVHAEMALQRASASFERSFRKSEEPTRR
ncbi:MAG TPA: nucleoside triphosphate pyrophosphohydrolase [bacterium]|nr:nucleoside triphosphate pyrophosphohydrolase [bacterium]